jgi:uncharacterized protein YbbK (DUF523 family)
LSHGSEHPIRLGVSSCLLGHAVRYDGGHKRNRWVVEELGAFAEWVPVCPEVEVGMGTPRPPLQLERDGDATRLVEIESRRDHTRDMHRFAETRVRELRRLDLSGYVLKRGSPSCGLARVPLHQREGPPRPEGTGLFAAALLQAFPDLPIEDEERLEDARLREGFVERVLAYRR